ncbi:MAG: mannosyltransferase [Flavobacteriales bacterium]|nr:mannosyltransferase [Flavobacteriia bacterium]NCP06760.1 mannosyltransferase [Flavobacteriales bacterium]PIV94745.1 MAG: mannosyltransferase [Flavobacteriaceae bacterium CG17_big_fil_post_rev_8_21_14_2_50_33_15]PIY13186.1 MAG: mannosyltransferase [Flavobacteriaceae bacterium CG_4_10_14_3_um_filter_33_47]PJB18990.1 MAG: mannosyltransferase [Flavobacteriaceae bacterium CG_4_9_14_3_um_filter_33_16]
MLLNHLFFKIHKTTLLFGLITILFYLSFAYDLNRHDYIKLMSLYTALFILFYKLIQLYKQNFTLLVVLAFGFRFLFLFAIPNLSQDFYRFIWDGRMIIQGFNPYLYTPESFILKASYPIFQAQELYDGMGVLNGSHFTNYPPLNQLCFIIAGLFAGKSILGSAIMLRLIIIIADFGTLYFGKKLLEKLNIPVNHIFWYLLNPFIIIELTGNLHFEGVMIFFLVWSLYLLNEGKWKFAAVIFACSVSVKLIPLMFLPVLFQKLAWKKSIGFYSIVGLLTISTFIPFIHKDFIVNYTETIRLWFQRFEFNASLYYVARAIGYSFRGYNEIAIIGKFIPLLVIAFVMTMAFFRKNKTMIELISAFLLVLTFYYFTATTVHPWYIASLLFLSIFTKYRFPLVWSFIGILSYLAYANSNNTENLWMIALEYIIVYAVFIWEVFLNKKKLFHNL